MKKLLSIGLLTVCAFALSEHNAQAWVNSKFSIGLNWHHQSGNTSYLWGLWRNGQIPGPEAYGPGPGVAPPYGPPPYGAPAGQGFPFLGAQNGYQPGMQQGAYQQGAYQQGAFQPGMQQGFQGYPQNYQQNMPTNLFMETTPPPLQNTAQQQPSYNPNMGWYGNNPFQSVSYQSNNYGYGSYQPSYNYSSLSYGAPYYWYGAR